MILLEKLKQNIVEAGYEHCRIYNHNLFANVEVVAKETGNHVDSATVYGDGSIDSDLFGQFECSTSYKETLLARQPKSGIETLQERHEAAYTVQIF